MSNLSHYCNICEADIVKFSPYGKIKRNNALCPVCTSLERHRLFKCWFDTFKNQLPTNAKILHFAPEEFLAKHFVKIANENYLSADIKVGRAMKVEDITKLSFSDNSFDFIFCSHVLHHVIDDDVAISELYRVLANNGTLALMNSVGDTKAKEINNILPNGSKYFKRFYNKLELRDKLLNRGFKVEIVIGKDLVSNVDEAFKLSISQNGLIFICTKQQV